MKLLIIQYIIKSISSTKLTYASLIYAPISASRNLFNYKIGEVNYKIYYKI